ncbi:hypothetical protein GH714_039887 [Hevea brasiliensis]|uniref:CG-1 domain-containing protein n=1 Tax=Hevea brasiliensis TaxID=3981 RepID=A0A6A6M7P7_HEVBR|nr:hypothetical protein GH714_039887 [Hevea brasiliensis]
MFKKNVNLDFGNTREEARTRWFRPNEIQAILCNYKYFLINVKPVHLPKSGDIMLFDRKKLRNFRKDGHNWKKKNDGKTVKEAHEHLKVGNEEGFMYTMHMGKIIQHLSVGVIGYLITLVWRNMLLLVIYLYAIELFPKDSVCIIACGLSVGKGSPVTPMNSNSSLVSDQSPWLLSEEFDSGVGHAYHVGEKEALEPGDSLTVINHVMRIHEINTLEWDDLVMNNPRNSLIPKGDKITSFDQRNQVAVNGSSNDGISLPAYNLSAEIPPLDNLSEPVANKNSHLNIPEDAYSPSTRVQVNSNVHRKDSSIIGTGHDSYTSPEIDQLQSSVPEQIFVITDTSHAWAYSTEMTKILLTGYFHEQYLHLAKSNLCCVCGDACVRAEIVQAGVYRCLVSPHSPGIVNLFLSLDGLIPISQVLNFEYRAALCYPVASSEDKPNWEEFKLQMRLAYLLFSTSRTLNILTSKVSPANLNEAKMFSHKTSSISHMWAYFIKSIEDGRFSFAQAKDGLFELSLKNMIKEWLLERVVEGCKITEYDAQGQGVIHLCAILGYTWAVYLFSSSALSLDFRDKHGWTALHWASYYGRYVQIIFLFCLAVFYVTLQEKMVAVLLSAGAKPNLVTDPTSENPGGCTAADLASAKGYDGLAGYLSEKSLVAHFKDMSIAGNVSGSLRTSATDTVNSENLSEEELYLKDTLAAYRTAADAAARIQVAFGEHSLKVRTKAVQLTNPEDEAQIIVAAMKIQHSFRNYETRKKMAAAAHIQYRFRSWKMQKEFLNIREHAIKIQAAFRGFQVRRQYRKIVWSVGVLEKAILRWRLKRRGFRGLRVDPAEVVAEDMQESNAEEDFYHDSRKQAEKRVEKAVVRVQAMFRSKKAQEEYRRMKLTHNQAELCDLP